MNSLRFLALVACLCPAFTFAEDVSFNRDIRPILSNACFACHGPDASHREADLRLDEEDSAKSAAIDTSDPEASELIARILSDDPEYLMPPGDHPTSLSAEQKDLLVAWVKQGANYEAHWAYVVPKNVPIPTPIDTKWARDPLDCFLLADMQANGVRPAPDASTNDLIRRVAFDLTGLPPSPHLVQSFTNSPSQRHYREIVDELLASPAFGERMAIYWLDLVRYADTVGYHGDQDHNISPYRDYVIDAFNDNMPLDQFAREQLAGDLIEGATSEQLIASGYNRLLQTSHEGGVQPKEYLAIYAADRIRNFSQVWMGATIGCAQCHDHKFDPYTSEDFYSLVAFFADLDEAQHFKSGTNSLPTKRAPEIAVWSRWQRQRIAEIERESNRLSKAKNLSQNQQNELASLNAEQRSFDKAKRWTMISKAIEPREIRVLPRGNWLDESGPVVRPNTPGFLNPIVASNDRATRLDLAEWLTDSDSEMSGLTARVFVNRFWYLFFGRGISTSLGDFGGQGVPPTHPALLDRLSIDFVQSGWDIKSLVRRLVLSRAYQQSSVVSAEALKRDPYNRWFSRQARYRLSAEMVRDNSLAISDLLVQQIGGASVKPLQPAGYYRHLNFPTRKYKADGGSNQFRRGVYVHWQRQFLHPMLKALDAPSREECTAQRPRSNTPLEALVLLNDPAMLRAAIGLGTRIRNHGGSDAQRLRYGFLLATAREPDSNELRALMDLLQSERAHFSENSKQATALLSATRVETDSADKIDEIAAWTSVGRTLMNLHETVSRN